MSEERREETKGGEGEEAEEGKAEGRRGKGRARKRGILLVD